MNLKDEIVEELLNKIKLIKKEADMLKGDIKKNSKKVGVYGFFRVVGQLNESIKNYENAFNSLKGEVKIYTSSINQNFETLKEIFRQTCNEFQRRITVLEDTKMCFSSVKINSSEPICDDDEAIKYKEYPNELNKPEKPMKKQFASSKSPVKKMPTKKESQKSFTTPTKKKK